MSASQGTISVYGLTAASVVNYPLTGGSSRALNGPWQNQTTLTAGTYSGVKDIATITSSVNVLGFLDGTNRAKFFASHQGSTVTAASPTLVLPTLSAAPNAVPPGAVALGASNTSFVYAVVDQDTSGNYFVGSLIFQLTPAAGSPDAASPMIYTIDQYGLLITDTSTSEWQ